MILARECSAESPLRVPKRGFREGLGRDRSKLGQAPGGMKHQRRLAFLSSKGHGRQVGAVGFHQNALERRPAGNVLNRLRALEGDDPRKGEVEPEIESSHRKTTVFAKAVDDAAHVARPFAFENVERVVGSRARVHDDGLSNLAGQTDEGGEDLTLPLPRGVVVVIVEANLPDRGNLGRKRELAQAGVKSLAVVGGVVRVQADARGHPVGKPAREVDGKARWIDRVSAGGGVDPSQADDDEPNHACASAALDDAVGPLGKVMSVEMAVRVDETKHDGRGG